MQKTLLLRKANEITGTNLGSLGIFHPTMTEKEFREIISDMVHLANESKVLLTGNQDIHINRIMLPEINNAVDTITNLLRTHWDDPDDQDIINIVKLLTESKQEIENIKSQLKL